MSLPLIPVDGRELRSCVHRMEWSKPSCPIKKNWCVFLSQYVSASVCDACDKAEPGIMEQGHIKG